MDIKAINEICDVVSEDVLKEVQKTMDEMRTSMITEITASFKKKITAQDNKIKKLQEKNRFLELHITELEKKIEAKTSHTSTVSCSQSNLERPEGNTLSSEQMDYVRSFPDLYRESNGWIYYIKIVNKDYWWLSYGELYRVRPNGKENQKIFSGKLTNHTYTHKLCFKVDGTNVYFKDSDGNDRVIKVESEDTTKHKSIFDLF